MSTLTPQGEKIRSLRLDRGWTQLELALAAGVSDRTVRNAEKSRPIRRTFLEFIAAALGAPLASVSEPGHALVDHLRWQSDCAKFLGGLQEAMTSHDPRQLLDLSCPDFAMHLAAMLPGVDTVEKFMGQYHYEDIPRYVENVRRFWELNPGGVFTLDEPFGSGDTVVIRGNHELWRRDGSVAWGRFTYVGDFDGGRIRNIQGLMVPGCQPAGVVGILTP